MTLRIGTEYVPKKVHNKNLFGVNCFCIIYFVFKKTGSKSLFTGYLEARGTLWPFPALEAIWEPSSIALRGVI